MEKGDESYFASLRSNLGPSLLPEKWSPEATRGDQASLCAGAGMGGYCEAQSRASEPD